MGMAGIATAAALTMMLPSQFTINRNNLFRNGQLISSDPEYNRSYLDGYRYVIENWGKEPRRVGLAGQEGSHQAAQDLSNLPREAWSKDFMQRILDSLPK